MTTACRRCPPRGQSRRFDRAPATSGPPRKADITSCCRDASKVPISGIAREREHWRLVEGHADSLLLAPDDVTGNVRAVRLKEKVEMPRDGVGVGNIERRPRDGHVAD
jgi:hypothetical protein